MKKLLISIGSVAIMAFAVVLFVNAAESGKDKKKPATEVKAGVNQAPCSATCTTAGETASSKCQPAACNESAGKAKEHNCDPSSCQGKMETASKETKPCEAAATCAQTCKHKTEGLK